MVNFDYINGFSFDDMLLIPKYSEIRSRSEVDLSVELSKGFKFSFPVVPSNMKTISELEMAKLMYAYKSLAIFHRFCDFDQQLKWLEEIKTWGKDVTKYIGFSTGVKYEDKENVVKLIENGAEIICIDIAHGYSEHCLDRTYWISSMYPHVLLISGNAAMGDGASKIWEAGADICKAGIGAGSICQTRVVTGNGVPSLTTLHDCYNAKLEMEKKLGHKLFLINDGGCKNSADIVKALCFADLTMNGNMFAATDQTPGEIIELDKKLYKSYVGSSTHRGNYTEGVEGYKLYKGSAEKVIQQISEGLKSGCSYQGVRNLADLKKDPKFVKISNAGLKESHAHDMDVILK